MSVKWVASRNCAEDSWRWSASVLRRQRERETHCLRPSICFSLIWLKLKVISLVIIWSQIPAQSFFSFFVCNSISASVRKMKLISSFAFIYLPCSTDRRNMSGHFCVGETAAAASSGTWELFASEEMCDLRSSWFDSMSSFRSDIKIRGDRGLEVCWWLV